MLTLKTDVFAQSLSEQFRSSGFVQQPIVLPNACVLLAGCGISARALRWKWKVNQMKSTNPCSR